MNFWNGLLCRSYGGSTCRIEEVRLTKFYMNSFAVSSVAAGIAAKERAEHRRLKHTALTKREHWICVTVKNCTSESTACRLCFIDAEITSSFMYFMFKCCTSSSEIPHVPLCTFRRQMRTSQKECSLISLNQLLCIDGQFEFCQNCTSAELIQSSVFLYETSLAWLFLYWFTRMSLLQTQTDCDMSEKLQLVVEKSSEYLCALYTAWCFFLSFIMISYLSIFIYRINALEIPSVRVRVEIWKMIFITRKKHFTQHEMSSDLSSHIIVHPERGNYYDNEDTNIECGIVCCLLRMCELMCGCVCLRATER